MIIFAEHVHTVLSCPYNTGRSYLTPSVFWTGLWTLHGTSSPLRISFWRWCRFTTHNAMSNVFPRRRLKKTHQKIKTSQDLTWRFPPQLLDIGCCVSQLCVVSLKFTKHDYTSANIYHSMFIFAEPNFAPSSRAASVRHLNVPGTTFRLHGRRGVLTLSWPSGRPSPLRSLVTG